MDSALFLLRLMTIALGGGVLGIAVFVMLVYWKAYKRSKRTPIAHVGLIATSYCILVVMAILTLVKRALSDVPVEYYTFLSLPAFILGIIALLRVLRYEYELAYSPKAKGK